MLSPGQSALVVRVAVVDNAELDACGAQTRSKQFNLWLPRASPHHVHMEEAKRRADRSFVRPSPLHEPVNVAFWSGPAESLDVANLDLWKVSPDGADLSCNVGGEVGQR